ncbi:MAG: 6-bladed beta-propeller [Gammaproteobacteria bacterium]|nr:6-bladed beta-propeller [Gammaproteobacteria bacterium]
MQYLTAYSKVFLSANHYDAGYPYADDFYFMSMAGAVSKTVATNPAGSCYGIDTDSEGNIYICTYNKIGATYYSWITKFDSTGTYVKQWGGATGSGDGYFDSAGSLAVSPTNNRIYVVDVSNARIQVFDLEGNFITKWGSYGTGNSQFRQPADIAIDATGNVYVVDRWNAKVKKFTDAGTYITSWPAASYNPLSITIDEGDTVYLLEIATKKIYKYTLSGGGLGEIAGLSSSCFKIRSDLNGHLYYIENAGFPACYLYKIDTDGTNKETIASIVTGGWAYYGLGLGLAVTTAGEKKFNSIIAMDGGIYNVDSKKYNSIIQMNGGSYILGSDKYNSIISMNSLSSYNKTYNSIISMSNDLYERIPFQYTLSERLYLACKARILGFTDDGHMPFNSAGGTL